MGVQGAGKSEEVQETIKMAIEIGYRHIDTASAYKNEKRIGEALKDLFAAGKVKREDLFIVSKLPNDCHRPEAAKKCIQQCLTDLQLSYLDLFLIHSPLAIKPGTQTLPRPGAPGFGDVEVDKVPVAVTWKAMESFVKEGLTKSIGVSSFSCSLLHDLISSAEIVPAVNQVELHPYLQQPHLVEYCRNQNVHLTAFAPVLRGMGYAPTWFSGEYPPKLAEEPIIETLAKKYGKTVAQIVLRWGIQRGVKGETGATSVIPKSSNPVHLKENFGVFDFELSVEDIAEIAKLDRNYRTNKGHFGGMYMFD